MIVKLLTFLHSSLIWPIIALASIVAALFAARPVSEPMMDNSAVQTEFQIQEGLRNDEIEEAARLLRLSGVMKPEKRPTTGKIHGETLNVDFTDLKLVATVDRNGERIAYIENLDEIHILHAGDLVSGWTTEEVKPSYILLRRAGEQIELPLFDIPSIERE